MNSEQSQKTAVSNGRIGQWSKTFIWSACIIFAITGLAKVISATGSAEILGQKDPIFGMPFRYLLLLVGVIELAVPACWFSGCNHSTLLAATALISTNLLLYRLSLLLIGYRKPCPCLGSLTSEINISPRLADLIMKTVLLYLTTFSYIELYRMFKKNS
jgi:hypothetical protein